MTKDKHSNEYRMLRTRIELSARPPYVVLISSALAKDGKGVCARGLAESMVAAGHRTLFVDLDPANPTLEGCPEPKTLLGEDGTGLDRCLVTDPKLGFSVLSLTSEALQSSSREAVASYSERLRERFDAIVVASGSLVTSSLGTLFANVADAVILTARRGRSIKPEDAATLRALEREGARFLGVVSIAPSAIDNSKISAKSAPVSATGHASNAPIPVFR